MKQNHLIYILILIVIFAFSCKKISSSIGEELEENYIDHSQADIIAISFMSNRLSSAKNNQSKNASISIPTTKVIKSNFAFKAKDGSAAYYIINYDGGGFVIISADRRTPKILAFSETNSFNTDTVPSGLGDWMNTTKNKIEELREKKVPYTGQDKVDFFQKDISSKNIGARNIPIDTSCTGTTEEVGPLLQTAWDQVAGYNNDMPNQSCGPNGLALTGCVATAMAQIIRYHEYPANWYNYSIMQNRLESWETTSTGANEIAKIMHDAAVSVGANYLCGLTEADTEDVPSALINTFGYSNTTNYINYQGTSNYQIVQSELRAGRPVIFRGGRDGGFWSIPRYRDGHAWVCDGFFAALVCNENGGWTGAAEYLYLNMNWGWSGYNNGYFGFNDFTPGSSTYNYGSGVVVGIKP